MAGASGYDVVETDTAVLEASDAREFWREHVRFNHGGLESRFDRSGSFDGTTVVQRSGEFQLMEFSSDAIEYVRSRADIRADDDRSLRVLVPRTGRFRMSYGEDRAVLEPGSAVALTMSSPFVLGHDDGARAWVVTVPEALQLVSPLTPRMFDLRGGLGAVTGSMLKQAFVQRNALSVNDFREIETVLIAMLGAIASDRPRWPDVAQSASALVRAQSDDPSLTPTTLARRLGWSLRHVQAVLATVDTTPSDLIRECRLERAKARLNGHDAIAAIALKSGFGSLSTFNAAFRARYGMSPSEARERR